jgi:large subunit ribosomal protein L24
MKIKKGDTVVVIAGRDRGEVGKVIRAMPTEDKVVVEGVNIVKKHTKPQQTARGNQPGGIIEVEAPIHVSNVAYAVEAEVDVDGKTEKRTVASKVGYRVGEDGTKVRFAKRTGEDI